MSNKKNPKKNPEVTEEVCFNCKHMLWLVGLGQGVKCRNEKNMRKGKMLSIPSRWHNCELFERKVS